MRTFFKTLCELGETLEKTKSRLKLASLVSEFLKKLAPEEIIPAIRLLLGDLFPGLENKQLNISWATLWKILEELVGGDIEKYLNHTKEAVDAGETARLLLEAVDYKKSIPQQLTFTFNKAESIPSEPTEKGLSLLEVYNFFQEIASITGPRSRDRKEEVLRQLLIQATPLEAKYIVKIILGEMRINVSEGIILDAISNLTKINRPLLERAQLFLGDLGKVAELAILKGEKGIQQIPITLFRPLKPMLAQTAKNVAEAFDYHNGKIALEYKLDGARVQIHKSKDEVRIYSRNLKEITQSLPEICKLVKENLKAEEAIVEGEVIAINKENKRPLPFQELMRRFRRLHEVELMLEEIPTELYLFDVLYLENKVLIDLPYRERWLILEHIKGNISTVPRCIPSTIEECERFLLQSYEAGHEGVMAKYLESIYTPGLRGKAWFKIKSTLSLDLVIIAAEYGYGRRHGWLSNYHLAARDEQTGEFLMLGKTFKGLTDEEFEKMTLKLKELAISEKGHTVYVKPNIVVEVEFNEIQKSSQYKSGYALRFARIARIRDDKDPQEADTIQTVSELYQKQFRHKSSL